MFPLRFGPDVRRLVLKYGEAHRKSQLRSHPVGGAEAGSGATLSAFSCTSAQAAVPNDWLQRRLEWIFGNLTREAEIACHHASSLSRP
jgi:hypothetical protein